MSDELILVSGLEMVETGPTNCGLEASTGPPCGDCDDPRSLSISLFLPLSLPAFPTPSATNERQSDH